MRKVKKFNIRSTMDDLSNDKRDERLTGIHSLYTQATGIFVSLLIFYSFLLKFNIVGSTGYLRNVVLKDLFHNEIISGAYDLLFENVILALLFFVLLVILRFYNQKMWIAKNKRIWVKGLWLHIHEKSDSSIRVGYVKITQSFDNINAEAFNYDAKEITNPGKRTTWEYYNARIDQEYLRGFYHSVKADQSTNSGMHNLKIVKRIFDYPVELQGHFGDHYILDSTKLLDINDHKQHCGLLTFFRMTKKQEDFLIENGEITAEKFEEMIKSLDFENDEFVKRYKEAMK